MLHKKINIQAGMLAAYQTASSTSCSLCGWLQSDGTVITLVYIAGRL